MRVTSVSVEKLFGMFDHEIPLHSTDRVTIILGPNGFGKTMILRMIAGLIRGQTTVFRETPFAKFVVTVEDETTVIINRVTGQQPRSGSEIRYELRQPTGEVSEVPAPPPVAERVLDEIDHLVPARYRRSGEGWEDDEGRQYPLSEI